MIRVVYILLLFFPACVAMQEIKKIQEASNEELAYKYRSAIRFKLSYDVLDYVKDHPEDQKSQQVARFIDIFVEKCLKRRTERGSVDINLRPEFDDVLHSTPNSAEERDFIVLGKTSRIPGLRKSDTDLRLITSSWWWKDYFIRIKQQIYLERSTEYYKKAVQNLRTSDNNSIHLSLELGPH